MRDSRCLAANSLSGDKTHPFDFSQCGESSGPVLADDSQNKAYFKELLQKGAKAPLEYFLALWYPDRVGANLDEANVDECKKEELAYISA